jgi:hypothetical protein
MWAVNNPEEAVCFFSRLYCKAAVRVLGYSNSNDDDAEEEEDTE